MDNLCKIGRSLMDNWGKIRQLINILFCGYQRRLEIADSLNGAETYTRAPASKNRVALSNGVRCVWTFMKLRLHAAICRVDFGAF